MTDDLQENLLDAFQPAEHRTGLTALQYRSRDPLSLVDRVDRRP